MGTRYAIAPIAPIEELTTRIPAGVITFGLELRELNPTIVGDFYRGRPDESDVQLITDELGDPDDGGPSVHVFSTESDLEYLRFDCFENLPHYHYVHPHEEYQVVHEMDPVAFGDPFVWTTSRLRTRLAAMLVESGGAELAAGLDDTLVNSAIGELVRLHDAATAGGRK
jgi:hypothetical protein